MNRLSDQTSLYLLQHAKNPVNWFPWGDDAFRASTDQNKLLFISIGYSACHWCHVMERESFENAEIADFLNRHFISVKVDREERPDVDKTYMASVQVMTGTGGWPLSCFATPDGKPFYGGTYFPASQFLDIIRQLAEIWKSNPGKILRQSERLTGDVIDSEIIDLKGRETDFADAGQVFRILSGDFDTEDGGLKRVPKFLSPVIYQFLLRYSLFSVEPEALEHSELTVRKLCMGGIYDQLRGGISRYSTDKKWFVPHFEKMLYDNSQFISLLSELSCISKNKYYLEKAEECLEFCSEYLSGGDARYFSSTDADSEGEEGKYYFWKYKEVLEICGKDFPVVKDHFGLEPDGNWMEGKNILSVKQDIPELALNYRMDEEKITILLRKLKNKMLLQRNRAIPPATDRKILTSWNALHIIALYDTWQAGGSDKYIKMALQAGEMLLKYHFTSEGKLKRLGNSDIPAFLDDYAFTIKAFFRLYQAEFDEKWIIKARQMTGEVLNDFQDETNSMFYYSPRTEKNPAGRHTEVSDNVLPSSNAVMAEVLLYSSVYFDEEGHREIALQMIRNMRDHLISHPGFFSHWASIQVLTVHDITTVVITGEKAKEYRNSFRGQFLPEVLFAGAERSGTLGVLEGRFREETSQVHICRGRSCSLPLEDIKKALEMLLQGR